MPICLDESSGGRELALPTNHFGPAEFREHDARCIRIGLLNNMRDAALEATERQFLTLLNAASDGILIRLSFHALPEIPRSEARRRHLSRSYSRENLWNGHLDGLIVTGREPQTPNLRDEPYWEGLTRVLEWADAHTHSTIWSCLAAHAAVLHMDGIGRRKSDTKYVGVFQCQQLSDHHLTVNTPLRVRMPHSRWNDLPEDDLRTAGYGVITRAQDAGVDTFVKQRKSLFVFFQGHPEYESETLLLEYRRDIRRYLRGETDKYPTIPRNYFGKDAALALAAIQARAMSARSEGLLSDVDNAVGAGMILNTWCSTAACLYTNWLAHICRQKALRLRRSKTMVQVQEIGVDSVCSLAAGASYPQGTEQNFR
jgi:homoserine O-succinyltransferase